MSAIADGDPPPLDAEEAAAVIALGCPAGGQRRAPSEAEPAHRRGAVL